MIWLVIFLTTSACIANPRPSIPSFFIVFIPTILLFMFTSGPPEFPGFIGTSVCTYFIPFWFVLSVALMIPSLTLNSSPAGLPTAITLSPVCVNSTTWAIRFLFVLRITSLGFLDLSSAKRFE